MGLPWIRLDTSTFDHPKVLELMDQNAYRTLVLHLSAMTYAGKHGTDGHVSKVVLRRLGGRIADANLLVAAELWDADSAGWVIHGWSEYQVSNEDSQRRAQRARKGGCVKNHGPQCGCWQTKEAA